MTELPVSHRLVDLMVRAGIPHCQELGIEVVEVTTARCTLKLAYQERLVGDAQSGILHGGVITTLIDTASGMSVQAALSRLTAIATLDLRIDYLRPSTPRQELVATAECYKLTRHIGFVRSSAHNGDPGRPVANSVATFMIQSSDKPVLSPRAVAQVASLLEQ